jgi:serine/threonine-protein kinase BUR1
MPFYTRYRIIKEAGKGAFGSVFKAEDTSYQSNDPFDNRRYVAIKKLFYDRRYEQRELATLDDIKRRKMCSNIIELRDRYFQNIEEEDSKNYGQTVKKEYLFIVTDYLPYTICDLRVGCNFYQNDASFKNEPDSQFNFCLESIKQVMKGIFKGLKDLHSLGITHRDIKLSNILIDNNQYPVNLVKVCDLGSSKKLVSNPNDESTQSLNYIGTRSFRAPELLVGNKFYNTKIDVWSAGVVFLKLISKYLNKKANVFDAKSTKHLCETIKEFIGEPTREELKEMLATDKG